MKSGVWSLGPGAWGTVPAGAALGRREFLGALGAVVGTVACGRRVEGDAAVAAASAARDSSLPAPSRPIGIQLYTLRREMANDFDGTLARVAAIGYTEVEFAGYYDRTPAQIADALRRHRLTSPSSHIGGADAVRKEWDRTLDAARSAGHRFVVVAWIDEKERKTLDDYRRLADEFDRAGARAKEQGLRFAYHNHDFEFAPIGGQIPYDLLVTGTDPANVAFELDLFWIAKGGQKALAYFDRFPGRFPLVHVKDMGPGGEMMDVGRGTLDWPQIFAASEKAGIEHRFVEHDEPRPDGFESARVSYEYLARLAVR